MAERSLAPTRAAVALHHTGPTTQRALADLLAVTSRYITGLLDGLSADGYILREPPLSDRRAVLVILTDRGRWQEVTRRYARPTVLDPDR